MKKSTDLVSINETAEELGISTMTVQRFFQRGWLNRIRVGGRVFIKREQVEFIKENGTPNLRRELKW